jgi:hypothetical protein
MLHYVHVVCLVHIFIFSQPGIRKGSETRRQEVIYDPSVGTNMTDWIHVMILYTFVCCVYNLT